MVNNKNILLCAHIIIVLFSLNACSSGGWIIDAQLADQNINRSPASMKPIFASTVPMVDNPCASLRFIQNEAKESNRKKPEVYRCNVVLNTTIDPNTKFSTKEADICISFSEHYDDRNILRQYFHLTGLLLKIENQDNKKQIKNIPVRSLRMAGEAYEDSNELLFQEKQNIIEITDLVPLSNNKQYIQFNHEQNILNYEIYQNKELLPMGLVEEKIENISVQLKCNPDVVYSSPN